MSLRSTKTKATNEKFHHLWESQGEALAQCWTPQLDKHPLSAVCLQLPSIFRGHLLYFQCERNSMPRWQMTDVTGEQFLHWQKLKLLLSMVQFTLIVSCFWANKTKVHTVKLWDKWQEILWHFVYSLLYIYLFSYIYKIFWKFTSHSGPITPLLQCQKSLCLFLVKLVLIWIFFYWDFLHPECIRSHHAAFC
jgi:hypothetical protein